MQIEISSKITEVKNKIIYKGVECLYAFIETPSCIDLMLRPLKSTDDIGAYAGGSITFTHKKYMP
jgi:hypothetical protein